MGLRRRDRSLALDQGRVAAARTTAAGTSQSRALTIAPTRRERYRGRVGNSDVRRGCRDLPQEVAYSYRAPESALAFFPSNTDKPRHFAPGRVTELRNQEDTRGHERTRRRSELRSGDNGGAARIREVTTLCRFGTVRRWDQIPGRRAVATLARRAARPIGST